MERKARTAPIQANRVLQRISAMLRRDLPRLFQEDVRIPPEPQAPHASLVPVVQRERLAT